MPQHTTSQSDDKLGDMLQGLYEIAACDENVGRTDLKPKRIVQYKAAIQAQLDEAVQAKTNAIAARELMYRTGLARAMGHMEGCGHPDRYLTSKFPEFATQPKPSREEPNE
jgi:hypothetical protein